MKYLTTQYASYLTGTDVADAVMAYGLALSRAHAVDLITIPFIFGDGSTREVQFTIGWHSRTDSITERESERAELLAPLVVADLRERTHDLHERRSGLFADAGPSEDWPSFA